MTTPPLKVQVFTLQSEMEFTIQKKTMGKTLFDMVTTAIGLRETWYFGLAYTDINDQEAWLDKDKKIVRHKIKPAKTLTFHFKFKYFPENVAEDIIQDNTLQLLYLQSRKAILTEKIYCEPEKCVILASYNLQYKYSDHDDGPDGHTLERFRDEKLLPDSVLEKHKLSVDEWNEKVIEFHKNHTGMSKEEAMLDYMKIVQDLEMYGITYFSVVNKRGTQLTLGVDAMGINIYDHGNKFNPTINFPWSEIKKVKHTKTSIKVKLNDKDTNPFIAKTADKNQPSKIHDLCAGNYALYKTRRSPDSLEVQQMKEEKKEKTMLRQREQTILRREMAARHKSEAAFKDAERRLMLLQEEMDAKQRALEEAQALIAELELKLRDAQAARDMLLEQQNELKALLAQLEEDKQMEESEKARLLAEIEEKREEIERIRTDVQQQEEASAQLQSDLEEARTRAAEIEENIKQKTAIPEPLIVRPRIEVDSEPEEPVVLNGAAEEWLPERDRKESVSSQSSAAESGKTSLSGSVAVDQHEPYVDEYREPDASTSDMLKELRKDLEDARDPEVPMDSNERQARENVSAGRDKFKTLRDVRSGNTKRRIDRFENMT